MNSTRSRLERVPTVYDPDDAFCSVVDRPHRCPLWGKASYRGNCDGTLFKNLVQWYRAKHIADPMVGSGTTRDVIQGLGQHGRFSGRFWSGDLRSGFDLLHSPLPGRYDFVWLHPPYWDIVRYSEHPSDLSRPQSLDDFLEQLITCLFRCAESLIPNGHLAVLIGDVRKTGAYYCLAHEVLKLSGRIGELCSVIIKTQHNCTSDRRTYARMPDVPIRHEYCLVFRKR